MVLISDRQDLTSGRSIGRIEVDRISRSTPVDDLNKFSSCLSLLEVDRIEPGNLGGAITTRFYPYGYFDRIDCPPSDAKWFGAADAARTDAP